MKRNSISLLWEKFNDLSFDFLIRKNELLIYLFSLPFSEKNDIRIRKIMQIPLPYIVSFENKEIIIRGQIDKKKPLKRLQEVGFCVDRQTAGIITSIQLEKSGKLQQHIEKSKQKAYKDNDLEKAFYIRLTKLNVFLDSMNTYLSICELKNVNYYQDIMKNVTLPKLVSISADQLTANVIIDRNNYILTRRQVFIMPLTKDLSLRGAFSAITSLMSGRKQEAVNYTAKMRRNQDGSYKGIDKTIQTKKEFGIYEITAAKVAKARRQEDGTYKGTEKTQQTKKDNGINFIAAAKIAKARIQEDGTYKGTEKTLETKRKNNQIPSYNHYRGKVCIFVKKDSSKILVRSTWEWLYAKYLEDNNYNWTYEPTVLLHGSTYHVPDFFVEEIGYIEIKPTDFLQELSEGYIKQFNITVITEKTFNFNSAYKTAKPFFKENFVG